MPKRLRGAQAARTGRPAAGDGLVPGGDRGSVTERCSRRRSQCRSGLPGETRGMAEFVRHESPVPAGMPVRAGAWLAGRRHRPQVPARTCKSSCSAPREESPDA